MTLPRSAIVIGLMAWSLSIGWSQQAPSGWTSFKRDGTVKARCVANIEDGKIVQTKVYDSSGNLEFTEIPSYNSEGQRTSVDRLDPSGRPWPYAFPVYGAAAVGGVVKLAPDIRQLCALLGEGSILEIVFSGPRRVEVKTGVMRGPLNGQGRYFDFQKEGETWIELDKNIRKSWVS